MFSAPPHRGPRDPAGLLENSPAYGIGPHDAGSSGEIKVKMTTNEFRQMALSEPQARYAAQSGAINFLIGERVFAALGGPDPTVATLRLTPSDQAAAMARDPSAFFPQAGGAGARGVTCVRLTHVDADGLGPALRAAVRRAAQRSLAPTLKAKRLAP